MSNSQEIIKCPFCSTLIQDLNNETYNDCKHLVNSGESIDCHQLTNYIEDIQIIITHYQKELKNLSDKQFEDLDFGIDIDLWLKKDYNEDPFLDWLGFEIERNHYDYDSPGYSGVYSFYFHKNWDQKLKELSEILEKLKLFDLIKDGVFLKILNKRFEESEEKRKEYKKNVELKKKEHQLKLDKELLQIHNWYEDGFLESIVEMVNQKTNPYKESYLKFFTKEELKEKLIKDIKERFQKKW
tara:strand:+ start:546 stop:1268 length:723 start_codon:yes stop_codon:yes gene_type:complete